MIWQDFFEDFWVWVVAIHVDVKISREEADQRTKILKIVKEIFGGLLRKAVKTDKVKFSLAEVYRGNYMFKTIVPGGGDERELESFIH